MKEKLYIYDIGETKRETDFVSFKGIGTTGQFIIQNYFRDKIEKSGYKFYPMLTVDCGNGVFEDVYGKYFYRPEINLEDYDLVYSLPEQFKYEKWHYDWHDDKLIPVLKENYKFNESFSNYCEQIYNEIDRPEIAYQIRETDKFDEGNCPLPTLFYEEHMKKYEDKIIFLCSDNYYSLKILKEKFPNVRTLETVRSTNFLPLHLFTYVSENVRKKELTEKDNIHSLMTEIYILWRCKILNYGLFGGIIGHIMNINTHGTEFVNIRKDIKITDRELEIFKYFGTYFHNVWKSIIINRDLWRHGN